MLSNLKSISEENSWNSLLAKEKSKALHNWSGFMGRNIVLFLLSIIQASLFTPLVPQEHPPFPLGVQIIFLPFCYQVLCSFKYKAIQHRYLLILGTLLTQNKPWNTLSLHYPLPNFTTQKCFPTSEGYSHHRSIVNQRQFTTEEIKLQDITFLVSVLNRGVLF